MPDLAIRTEQLTKRFGPVLALDRLDLEVYPGEVFGFLGPNGAGKSTTIRLLLDLIRPTSGQAWILGSPCSDVKTVHRRIGYVPGDVSLWPQLTGAQTLELLGNLTGRVDRAFRDELLERLALDPGIRVRAYSKGNRQKLALVAALMCRPDVLLLDEPTSGLDPLMEAEFQALAREASSRGQTVFLSSHLLDEVEDICTRVAILRQGRLVEVAALEDLRRMSVSVFDVSVRGPVPDLGALPGVAGVERRGDVVRVTVDGSPRALLAALADVDVLRIHSREPTLEEIFVTYYEATPEQREAVAAAHRRA